MVLKDREIVIGVTGSIAAYKALDLVSRLRKLGANVHVIMTRAATEFIRPLSLETISGNPVVSDMFRGPADWDIAHVSMAKKADIIVIAPATANIISKIAQGIADDMLTSTVLAYRGVHKTKLAKLSSYAPILIAPAMNEAMYKNPIFQENLRKCMRFRIKFIGPEKGALACGEEGMGRMVEIERIVKEIIAQIGIKQDLKNKNILITASATREFIDPVRYFSNPSTGKMGFALAGEARMRGANVFLVSGPTALTPGQDINYIPVISAKEMEKEVGRIFPCVDAVIMSAAVSDWTPEKRKSEKIKPAKGNRDLTLKLKRTPDILAKLGKLKRNKIIIGFCLESRDLVRQAKKKLKEKNLDFIVANQITQKGPFAADEVAVKIITKQGRVISLARLPKSIIARHILNLLANGRTP